MRTPSKLKLFSCIPLLFCLVSGQPVLAKCGDFSTDRCNGADFAQPNTYQPNGGADNTSQPFSLRGLQLGISLRQFMKIPHPDGKHASLKCNTEDCQSYSYSSSGTDSLAAYIDVAGSGMAVVFYLIQDLPSKETILHNITAMGRDNYDELRAALTEKYGPPTGDAEIPVQNGYGAKFMLYDTNWKNGVSTILLRKYSIQGDTALIYSLDRVALRLRADSEKRSGRPADKL